MANGKQKKQAMVKYNRENNSFELWIRSNANEEWDFSCCVPLYDLDDNKETYYIDYHFLISILNCVSLGYEIIDGRIKL